MQSDGEDDLVIKQAKPTCGCTVANILVEDNGAMVAYQYGKPIPPGRKIEIDATLHTINKRGHASSKININSNDPRGQTILSLEAEVDPFFNVNPQSINFNRLSAKDTATDKFTVNTTKGDRIKLTAVKDMLPQGIKVDVNTLDADADGKGTRFEVVVTAGPGLVEGNLAYSVAHGLRHGDPGRREDAEWPDADVRDASFGHGDRDGRDLAESAVHFAGSDSPGSVAGAHGARHVARCELQAHGSEGLDPRARYGGVGVREVLHAGRAPGSGENAVDVEVTLTGMPESLAGSFSGNLVIKTGHPERDEVKVLISGVCRGGTTGGTPAPTPTPLPLPGTTPPK
jgi:hypothetical protein